MARRATPTLVQAISMQQRMRMPVSDVQRPCARFHLGFLSQSVSRCALYMCVLTECPLSMSLFL